MLNKYLCLLLMAGLLAVPGACGLPPLKYRADFSNLFDTDMIVIGYAVNENEFQQCARIIRGRMEELHQLYDIYHPHDNDNNLYTVNQYAGVAAVEVKQEIIDLLLLAREGYYLTGGAVNVALGPVLRVWQTYREQSLADPSAAAVPPLDVLREAALLTDIQDVVIDEANRTVFLRKPGMSLDVGSVAKSYAAGLAVEAANSAGFKSVMFSAGGNITVSGKPLDGVRDRWGIGIQDPDLTVDGVQHLLDTVFFNDLTVSCSGGYLRYYVADGRVFHHVIDPETLMPAGRYKQVAVIHKNPGMADILSTALFIMPHEQGAALAAQHGADALWVDLDGNWLATDGYAGMSKELGGYSAVDD